MGSIALASAAGRGGCGPEDDCLKIFGLALAGSLDPGRDALLALISPLSIRKSPPSTFEHDPSNICRTCSTMSPHPSGTRDTKTAPRPTRR